MAEINWWEYMALGGRWYITAPSTRCINIKMCGGDDRIVHGNAARIPEPCGMSMSSQPAGIDSHSTGASGGDDGSGNWQRDGGAQASCDISMSCCVQLNTVTAYI